MDAEAKAALKEAGEVLMFIISIVIVMAALAGFGYLAWSGAKSAHSCSNKACSNSLKPVYIDGQCICAEIAK